MAKIDYSDSLLLTKTDFPMRAGLPDREPEILQSWARRDLYTRRCEQGKGSEPYILHDGPPYANGHLHIGHALNKIVKDVILRSMYMLGRDVSYVPGWDCHGLPIEWKVEAGYRSAGKSKDEVPVLEFRKECRAFAGRWLGVQRDEFKRLGVMGDWDHPYDTMNHAAEARIACELMKFADTGQLYRGSKPVFWSIVERTALAEAEVDYLDHRSDVVWVGFPVRRGKVGLPRARILIWTTTPWTLPANRAICFSSRIGYGAYEVRETTGEGLVSRGMIFIVADRLVEQAMCAGGVTAYERVGDMPCDVLSGCTCAHPLEGMGYDFDVPLLDGDHVTADVGTGFVHTAPGHGMDDFEIWKAHAQFLEARSIETRIPDIIDDDGVYTKAAPGFEGRRILESDGRPGDANGAVIEALRSVGALFASGQVTHPYPHSWRSGKPLIFRNMPQWFISMDQSLDDGTTLRGRAMKEIEGIRFIPGNTRNRLYGMIAGRSDWVVSRQRTWGVPITVFVHKETGRLLKDEGVTERILSAFLSEGADSWFAAGAKERFLQDSCSADEWEKIDDILDVWFDSGSSHAFVLEDRPDLKWPADLYVEGTDQHRGWFQSSLLESCGTRGCAPYKALLTHGFVLDGNGRKMSKSLGNQVSPQSVVDRYGADILRLWVMHTDYSDDVRIGEEILKSVSDVYRRLRNSVRFLLNNLVDFSDNEIVPLERLPELERWILHRLWELDIELRQGYGEYRHQRLFSLVFGFATVDLSSLYFDVRKDVLYCDPRFGESRRACRTVLNSVFRCLTTWLAPILCFTMDEAWTLRFRDEEYGSVHLERFPAIPEEWRDDGLAAKFSHLRRVRRLVMGALELARANKEIGSGLEAEVLLYLSDSELLSAMVDVDMAEFCIVSSLCVHPLDTVPSEAFRAVDMLPDAAVVVVKSNLEKCPRCWRFLQDVGQDARHGDVCVRCAAVLDSSG